MNVTIKYIGKLAGVSSAAVSKALNGHSDISDETRKKILDICKELGYTPNETARNLARGSSNMIGLLIPDISTPIYSEIFKGMDLQAQKYGYSLFLCDTHRDISIEERYVRTLMEKRVKGIIIAPVANNADHVIEITRERMPVVYFGGKVNDNMDNYVSIDNFYGSKIAAEYLLSLGHREIYMVCDRDYTKTMSDRIAGYKSTMQKHSLTPTVYVEMEGRKGRESGYSQAKRIFRDGIIPSAIYACNDMVAIGIMEAAMEKGLKIPDDISLIGFDDIVFASLPTINLTTIAQPKLEIGRLTVDLLFNIISGHNPGCINREIIKPELVVRNTCRTI